VRWVYERGRRVIVDSSLKTEVCCVEFEDGSTRIGASVDGRGGGIV